MEDTGPIDKSLGSCPRSGAAEWEVGAASRAALGPVTLSGSARRTYPGPLRRHEPNAIPRISYGIPPAHHGILSGPGRSPRLASRGRRADDHASPRPVRAPGGLFGPAVDRPVRVHRVGHRTADDPPGDFRL